MEGCFGYDNGYSGSSKFKNCCPATMTHSRILLHHVYKQVTNFVLCSTTLVRFPEDGPTRTETCRDVKCDIVILINGARGGVVVKALRYKPVGRGFDSRWCDWNFSVT